MKKILIFISSVILITSCLCYFSSSMSKTDSSSNSSSQYASTSSNSTQYATDSVRYDCFGNPLSKYIVGEYTFGEEFGKSDRPYQTQITEISTNGNRTKIYTYENTIDFQNYVYFTVDNSKINVSRLSVQDWVRLYFDEDGDVIDIR